MEWAFTLYHLSQLCCLVRFMKLRRRDFSSPPTNSFIGSKHFLLGDHVTSCSLGFKGKNNMKLRDTDTTQFKHGPLVSQAPDQHSANHALVVRKSFLSRFIKCFTWEQTSSPTVIGCCKHKIFRILLWFPFMCVVLHILSELYWNQLLLCLSLLVALKCKETIKTISWSWYNH